MPELPEVETVRLGLQPAMEGRKFLRVEQRRPDLRFPLPERFSERLVGRRLLSLERRAKYLVGVVEGGDILVMHLGMTGRFDVTTSKRAGQPGEFAHAQGGIPAHDHVVFHMEGGARVTYNDVRRFGFMLLIPGAERETHALFRGLGVEPLGPDLTPEYLALRARGKKADLKAFLLDQRVIAGLGNIYVCEALFRTRLNPTKSASVLATKTGLPNAHTQRLVPEIKAILLAALQAGGSTLRDYRQADGALGYFQHSFLAYGREGEMCQAPQCKSLIKRRVQSGRSTFYCPTCQK
ncbi:MAG: bifunctional DNA-formamidopyrimidine glycosylase/DNA-(apurinic or apyrimidinic site) lyase [Hyphomicrobiaceae bacterium]